MVDRMLNSREIIERLIEILVHEVTILAAVGVFIVLDHLTYLVLVVSKSYFAAV